MANGKNSGNGERPVNLKHVVVTTGIDGVTIQKGADAVGKLNGTVMGHQEFLGLLTPDILCTWNPLTALGGNMGSTRMRM